MTLYQKDETPSLPKSNTKRNGKRHNKHEDEYGYGRKSNKQAKWQ